MKKITLNESELRRLIQNSIKRVIKENEQENYDWEYTDDDDFFFEDDDDDEIQFDPNATVDTEFYEDTGKIYKIPEAKIVIEKVPEFEELGPQTCVFFMGEVMTLMNFEECLYDVCRFEVDQYPVKERVFKQWLNSLNHEQLIEAFKKAMEG